MSSSAEQTTDFESNNEETKEKRRNHAPRTVLHINPSSWQPVLLYALVEESKEFNKPGQGQSAQDWGANYLLSERGWRLLEVLSQTHWRDVEVPGLSKHDLLDLLSKLFLSLDCINSTTEISFTEWDHLLVAESKLLDSKPSKTFLSPLGPETQGPNKPAKKAPKKPRYWDYTEWDHRESAEREVQMEEDQQSTSSKATDKSNHQKPIGSQQAPPYILQEDSDGFPLCWNEDAPIPGFEGGKLWLDDMILDMLHYQLPIKSKERSETGAGLMLLNLMKKAVGCFMGSPYFSEEEEREKFFTATTQFTSNSLTWEPAHVPVLSEGAGYDNEAVSLFLKSLLVSRHWGDMILGVITALAAGTSLSQRIIPYVLAGIKGLLHQLTSVCQLLTECSKDMAQASLEGAMEFLLESGHRLAVGLPCTADASLQLFPQMQLGDHLQVVSQILAVFAEEGYMESMRDLAIAMDLLAQVNYKPQRSRLYSESSTSSFVDNAYQNRLYSLLLSVASLSSRLQEAKTLWLHCSLCRRMNHERCALNQTPMVGHHHGILEFPERVSETPGFVPVEKLSREEISKKCGCAFLIRVLFECLKNVRDMENKELAYMALQCTGNCCCISPEVLLSNLLADLRELPSSSQKHLLKSVRTHLNPHVEVAIDGRILSCRMCDRDEKMSGDLGRAKGGYVAVLEGFFKTSDEAALIRLCKLVWSIMPTLTTYSREAICSQAVVPCLLTMCERVLRKDPPNLLTGMKNNNNSQAEQDQHELKESRDMKLINSLLGLLTAGLYGEEAYAALLRLFYPFGELLFYCPDTQKNFVLVIKSGALLESLLAAASPTTACGERIRTNEWPLNKFVFDKFLIAFKLCDKDLSNLIGESASQFWLVVCHVLELSRVLLSKSEGFQVIFGRYEGRNRCLQLISSCLTQMTQSGGEESWSDSKSAQRLTNLLGQVLSLALLSPTPQSAKEELLQRLSKVFFEYGRRSEKEDGRVGRPYLAYRLCGMLIDSSMGIPLARETPSQEINTRKKTQKKIGGSDSESSIDGGGRSSGVLDSESGTFSEDYVDEEDEGYEGDVELQFNPQNGSSGVVASLQHPELCELALKYLLVTLEKLSPQSARDFVAGSTIQKLHLICFNNSQNLTVLRQQGILETLHTLAYVFAHKPGDISVLKSILDLQSLFIRELPESKDIEKIIKMLRIETAPKGLIIDTLFKLLTQAPVEPTDCLVFPEVSHAAQEKQKTLVSSTTGGWKNVLNLQKNKSFSPKKAAGAKRTMPSVKPGMYGRKESQATPSPNEEKKFLSGVMSLFSSSSSKLPTKPSTSSESQSDSQLPPVPPPATIPKTRRRPSIGLLRGSGGQNSPTAAELVPEAAVILFTEGSGSIGTPLNLEIGLSVSFWVRVEVGKNNSINQEESGPYSGWWHMISIGNGDLSVSVYEHAENDSTSLRITNKNEVVQKKRYKKIFSQKKWVHIVLSVKVENRENLKVKMYANGVTRKSWEMTWKCSDLRVYLPSFVGIGHLSDVPRKSDDPKMEIGNLLGFKGIISHESVVLLCGLGPKCGSVADTRARTLCPSVYPLLRPALLCQELNMATLLEDQDGIMENLQKIQALCYLPTNPESFGIYIFPIQQQTGVDVGGPVESFLSLVRLKQFSAEIRCPVVDTPVASMDDAFANLGAARLLLMLFALTVDSGASEMTQARSLRLLLTGVQRHPEWWRSFCGMEGYSMIGRVLASHHCVKGSMLLHEICCASMMGVPETSEALAEALDEGSFYPIVQNPEIITALLGNPDVWKKNKEAWESGLGILSKALDEENLYASFNATQLTRGGFLKRLLLVCLDVAQEEKADQPAPSVATHLVGVIRSLIGSPPELSHLTALWDFVFLSHPAACTYLNYRISGHSSWINVTDINKDEAINLVRYESPLSEKLRQYFIVLGQEKLSTIMADNNGSVSAARREFELAAIEQPSFSYESTANIQNIRIQQPSTSQNLRVYSDEDSPDNDIKRRYQRSGLVPYPDPKLPDLVCDINPSQATSGTTTTGSESGGDEWSPDEITTDDYTTAAESDERIGRNQSEPLWVIETRAGLLEALSVVLLTGPDPLVTRLVGSIIKWEPLIVMLNHQPDPKIREGCVKVLSALFLRSDDNFRVKFMKSHGFQLLANQLREFPCTSPVADALFSVLCGEPLRLEEGLDASHLCMMTVNRFQCGVLEPIFVLLENSTQDTTLFWNVTSNIQKVFENNGVLAQAMLDNHLIEALVNVLLTLSKIDMNEMNEVTGLVGESGLLFECWHSLASKVLQSCLAFADLVHHNAVQEFITLLFEADWELENKGKKRGTQCCQETALLTSSDIT